MMARPCHRIATVSIGRCHHVKAIISKTEHRLFQHGVTEHDHTLHRHVVEEEVEQLPALLQIIGQCCGVPFTPGADETRLKQGDDTTLAAKIGASCMT